MDDNDYQMLITYIKNHISIDGNLYKERPFKRRIAVRMRYTNKNTHKEYLDYLREHSEEMIKLKNTLTINVTRFFRNRETFDFIKNVILREIIRKNQRIRILSAGCSTGEEPYSTSIMLNSFRTNPLEYEIVGIDVDSDAIEKAKIGIYGEFSFMEMKHEEVKRYFKKNGEIYILNEEIKRNVNFVIMDIKQSESLLSIGKFDLIICRNILIYFSKDFQEKIITDFHKILKSNGYLVLGKVEILTGFVKNLFETINRKERVFRKIDNSN